MMSGDMCMLMWRSRSPSSLMDAPRAAVWGRSGSSIAPVRIVVVAVGRARAPFADDIAHYERLLGRHVRLETIELREAKAAPERPREALAKEAAAVLRRVP